MTFDCRFEEDVRQAAMSGRWPHALSSHTGECDSCREVRVVAEALQQPHAHPSSRSISDPSALWACGRHARRIAAEARISMVVTATEIGVLVGVLAVVISFVDWRTLSASVEAMRLDHRVWLIAATSIATIALIWIAQWAAQDRFKSQT